MYLSHLPRGYKILFYMGANNNCPRSHVDGYLFLCFSQHALKLIMN